MNPPVNVDKHVRFGKNHRGVAGTDWTAALDQERSMTNILAAFALFGVSWLAPSRALVDIARETARRHGRWA